MVSLLCERKTKPRNKTFFNTIDILLYLLIDNSKMFLFNGNSLEKHKYKVSFKQFEV